MSIEQRPRAGRVAGELERDELAARIAAAQELVGVDRARREIVGVRQDLPEQLRFRAPTPRRRACYERGVAINLSVNLNKVALLRNSRGAQNPSPRVAGECCLDNGAYGLTLHWRHDNRHTRADDVRVLRALTRERGCELNLEGDARERARRARGRIEGRSVHARAGQAGRGHERSRLGAAARARR